MSIFLISFAHSAIIIVFDSQLHQICFLNSSFLSSTLHSSIVPLTVALFLFTLPQRSVLTLPLASFLVAVPSSSPFPLADILPFFSSSFILSLSRFHLCPSLFHSFSTVTPLLLLLASCCSCCSLPHHFFLAYHPIIAT